MTDEFAGGDLTDELTDDLADPVDAPSPRESTARQVRRAAIRIVLVVAALAFSGWVLATTFDDLDLGEVLAAIGSLSDAELISLGAMWLLWVASQGLLTASLVPHLPVRRGVIAFLGPAAVASIIPGPSDLPVRYRMLTSWGRTTGEATLAVAAGGIFSIGIKLVLPVVAAIGLLLSDAPIDGTMRMLVTIGLIVGLLIAGFAWVFGSERRTERVGRLIAPVWGAALRLLRKPQPSDLATRMVSVRTRSVQVLRERWLTATWGTVLTAATRYALLLMALRFTGTGQGTLSWGQVFVVFALVQGLTVIPITAGDAGVSEIAYIGLLTAAAGSEYVNQISAGVLIFRLITWLALIPVGLATIGFWKLKLQRHAAAVAAEAEAKAADEAGQPADLPVSPEA